MKWVEMIRVRSSATTLEEALPDLEIILKEINTTSAVKEAFLANHGLYEGDLSAVVIWDNDITPTKSKEGLVLADKLTNLGPVDHAVWIPVK